MADKKPQLNGAYYGPTIPPPEQARRHSHRGRRCCCCLFSVLWKIVVVIIIIIALFFFISWVVVQPHAFKFYVNEAELTQFNYTNNVLRYNLVLNFTVHNPNKKLNFYYDKVEANAFYEGIRFKTTDVVTWQNSFRQYTKSTDLMSGVFSGQRGMMLDQDQVYDYEEDKRAGVFDIDLKLYFTIRFRLGDFITDNTKARAKCELKVPLSSNGTTMAKFELTGCDVKF